MAENNDKPLSNEPSTGGQQQNQEAILFDEQTVMSRGQAQGAGDKVESLSGASGSVDGSGNENIQTSIGER